MSDKTHTKDFSNKDLQIGKAGLGQRVWNCVIYSFSTEDSGPEQNALSGLHKNRDCTRPELPCLQSPGNTLQRSWCNICHPGLQWQLNSVTTQHWATTLLYHPSLCFIALFPRLERQMGNFGWHFLVHYFQFKWSKREKRHSPFFLSNTILKIPFRLTFQIGDESHSLFASYCIISRDFQRILGICSWRFITQSLQFLRGWSLCDCNQETTLKGKKSI